MLVESEELDNGSRVLLDGIAVAEWRGRLGGAWSDVALCTALLPTMALRADELEVRGNVSDRLVANADQLQDVFASWLPDLRRVALSASQKEQAGRRTGGVACFFSGGVDSLHAVIANREEIDRLVYVEGFDVRDEQPLLRQRVRRAVDQAASMLELPLDVLSTDVRNWSDSRVPWPFYHGAALAAAAHCMAGVVDRVLIPSSAPYSQLYPWGSHPLTDPLWSGVLEIQHRGAASDRHHKIAAIVDSEVAQQTLRVCWRNPGEAFNCGRCEKCLRTMTTLAAYGALDSFETFPCVIDIDRVATLELLGAASIRHARINVDLLAVAPEHKSLRRAWEQALANPSVSRRAKRALVRTIRRR